MLPIVNKHGYIINYSNRLPAILLLVLIYFVFLLEKNYDRYNTCNYTGTVHVSI